jgi:hypothetical protein
VSRPGTGLTGSMVAISQGTPLGHLGCWHSTQQDSESDRTGDRRATSHANSLDWFPYTMNWIRTRKSKTFNGLIWPDLGAELVTVYIHIPNRATTASRLCEKEPQTTIQDLIAVKVGWTVCPKSVFNINTSTDCNVLSLFSPPPTRIHLRPSNA